MARRRKDTLTRLESEVMRVVWDCEPDAVRVRDVVDRLNAGRKAPLAYNTVQTMLTILRDKGVVETVDAEGRAHRYRARVSRDDASRDHVRDLVDRLFGGRIQPLLQALVDDPRIDATQLQELRRWVNAQLRDRDRGES